MMQREESQLRWVRRHRVQGKDICAMMYGDKGVTKEVIQAGKRKTGRFCRPLALQRGLRNAQPTNADGRLPYCYTL